MFLQFNVPFEIGVKITEKEYQEYGQALEKMLQDILEEDAKGNFKQDVNAETQTKNKSHISHLSCETVRTAFQK